MTPNRLQYSDDHWLRSHEPDRALRAYLEQQSKAYSRVKNAFVRELLGDLHGKRFLDYGCGAGMFTIHAALSGAAQIIGADAEQTVLETARYFAEREGVEKYCRFVHSEGFPQFSPDTIFDVILMKDVIEHVIEDEHLLEDAAAALKPGGTLVLSTQNAFSLNYLIQGNYHRVVKGNKYWFGWDDTHVRFYTPWSLKKKLRSAGLQPVGWRSVYIVPYKLPALPGSGKQFTRIDSLAWVDRVLGWVFPYNRIGWNLIVRAELSKAVPVKVGPAPMKSKVMSARPVILPPAGVTSGTTDPHR
jgi:2-polyprenyl-6-hydroxyphenyl methylase/3-demethylubiquinone-9 3-methyltransferase